VYKQKLNKSGFLGESVCGLLRAAFVVKATRLLSRGKVTIAQYHDPAPDVFRRHMEAFSRNYSFIGMDMLSKALESRDFSDLPPRSLLVTLDDGYKTNVGLLEVIRDYHVPVVIYAVAGIVDTNRHFWFKTPGCNQLEIASLKSCRDYNRRAILKKRGHYDEKEYEDRQGLSSSEARKFLEVDGAAIGSHTVFHPQLTMCNDETGIRECVESRKILEGITNRPVYHFAYPDGDSDHRVLNWVKSAGYRTARTANFGWVTAASDPFNLPCIAISDDAGVNKALVQVSGFWGAVKGLFGLRHPQKKRQTNLKKYPKGPVRTPQASDC